MPAVSLVVCLRKERDLLERLLRHCDGCYDDLVVVHDGDEFEPDAGSDRLGGSRVPSIDFSSLPTDQVPEVYREQTQSDSVAGTAELVRRHGGRFFAGPREQQQEPHWPFLWHMARHDWILRLDADEFPSPDLRSWLQEIRQGGPEILIAPGYACIWPLWDGCRAKTSSWPNGRLFLFNKTQVSYFGMVEHLPEASAPYERLPLLLQHQPRRKSYGMRNIVFRPQAYRWRERIATSLAATPLALARWNYASQEWPEGWERLRRRPLYEAARRAVKFPLQQWKEMIAAGERPILSACINPGLHHFLLAIEVWKAMRKRFATGS